MDNEINIRKIELGDYEFINKWWVQHGLSALSKDVLPMNGLGGIIIEKDKPIAAAYLYITNSKIGYIDNLITDPKYVSKDRFDIILMLIRACAQMAEEVGCVKTWAMTESEGILQRCKALGYSTSERNFARIFSVSSNIVGSDTGGYMVVDKEKIIYKILI